MNVVREPIDAAHISVHGFRARVSGDWPEVVEALRRDFVWYAADSAPAHAVIEIKHTAPQLDAFESLVAESVAERYVVYRDGDRLITDYHGRAAALLDTSGRRLLVQGEDGWVVRRAAFDFLLAQIDEHLESRGLPRVHGLGLSGSQGAILVMMPMASGKTTLALRALRDERVGFLSEGSPLLDRHGRVWPFPIPLWVRTTGPEAATLPPEHVRALAGIDPDPAILELSAFASRIPTTPVSLRHIVLGRRSLGRGASLEPLPRTAAVRPLLRESVAGCGFMRGVEFGLPRGSEALRHRLRHSARRAANCCAALSGASVWQLTLGRDREANWDALSRLLS